jgi:hypothetical protein
MLLDSTLEVGYLLLLAFDAKVSGQFDGYLDFFIHDFHFSHLDSL